MSEIDIMKPCTSCDGSGKWGPNHPGTPAWWVGPDEKICAGCKGQGVVHDFRAERRERHKARGGCPATVYHGPGRQSDSFCELPAGHQDHHRVTVAVWEWDNDEAYVDDFGEVREG